MLKEYVVDTDQLPWKDGSTLGVAFRGQVILDGDDGGPEAFRFRFEPCLAVQAHMHLVSQFQLLLSGTMDLPKRDMSPRPIGVFYTDHSRPYGPFAVHRGHEVLVLHPRKGGIVTMADRDFPKEAACVHERDVSVDRTATFAKCYRVLNRQCSSSLDTQRTTKAALSAAFKYDSGSASRTCRSY